VLTQAQRGQLGADLKTDASARTIPADDWVLQQITSHMQRYGTGVGEVIITNRVGKVAKRNAFGDSWRNAVRDARICGKEPAEWREGGKCGEKVCADPAHCLAKGTRFRDLRHFYASTLIAVNLNPKVIQARLGHATIAETMDTYGHLFPESEELGRGAIDAILSSVPVPSEDENGPQEVATNGN
jgi:integrase